MENMMKTKVLKALDGVDIKEVGKYICLPRVGLSDQPVWIVEVFKVNDFLCYNLPDEPESEKTRVVKHTGHKWFKLEE